MNRCIFGAMNILGWRRGIYWAYKRMAESTSLKQRLSASEFARTQKLFPQCEYCALPIHPKEPHDHSLKLKLVEEPHEPIA